MLSTEEETDPLAQTNELGLESAVIRSSLSSPSSHKLIPSVNEKIPIDESSRNGKFGWCQIADTFLPILYRKNENFVSVRVAEKVLLAKFLESLPKEVVDCPIVTSLKITEAEASLLNDINSNHTDFKYGREKFSVQDLIVKVSDVCHFHQYLELCHRKMVSRKSTVSDQCGFVRIGCVSDVPYIMVNGMKYLPVFYFEGELDNSKNIVVDGWNWAFIKFCCKIQGVKDELIERQSCDVVSVQEIRRYFPSGTSFEDYWPEKDFISRIVSNHNLCGGWTRIVSNAEGKFTGRLVQIKHFTVQDSQKGLPYKPMRCLIESKVLPCLNIRPFEFKEVMVTLPHLVNMLLSDFTEEIVGNLMLSSNVVMYKGNKDQVDLIKKERWEDKYESLPLVAVKDILSNFKKWKSTLENPFEGSKRSVGAK